MISGLHDFETKGLANDFGSDIIFCVVLVLC